MVFVEQPLILLKSAYNNIFFFTVSAPEPIQSLTHYVSVASCGPWNCMGQILLVKEGIGKIFKPKTSTAFQTSFFFNII